MYILSSKAKNFLFIFLLILITFSNNNMFISGFLAKDAFAITAEERLNDPILEKRARDISAKLRCLVCQNQSIDDSDAELAIDLRRQVRDYLQEGMTNTQIFQSLKEKYGEFVLLSPPIQPATYFLWAAPLFILVIGIFLIVHLFLSSKNHIPELSSHDKALSEFQKEPLGQNKTQKERKLEQGSQIPNTIRIALPVLILVLSVSIYMSIGSPRLLDQPLSQGTNIRLTAEKELLEKQKVELEAFNEARKRVEENPESLSAQFMLAATAAQIGSIEDEINALKKALLLSGDDSRIKSQLAEALTRQANGQVTKIASNLISEVLERNSGDIRALYLHGLELFQKGEFRKAISYWKMTATQILPNSPLADKLKADVEQAAKLVKIEMPNLTFLKIPTDNTSEIESKNTQTNVENEKFEKYLYLFSNLSQNEQNQFIKQMIERLSNNLQEQPNNFEGWLQLAQAYLSISELNLADDALISATKAISSNEQRIALIEFALLSHPSSNSTKLAGTQLLMLSSELKNSFSIKFLKGEYSRQIGDNKKAIMHWSDILNQMPEDSKQARTLQSYISSLENSF